MTDDRKDPDRGAAATLLRLAEIGHGPRLVMAEMVDALGDQGFGLLLLILALPNVIPGPYIPAFSIPFAVGCALLGLQLAIGERTPRLPGWVARRSVGRDGFRRFAGRAQPRLTRLERLIRPRPNWLTAGPGRRLIGLVTFVLSVVLALPVPFGNLPAALAISIIGLGLLQEDGLALACGIGAGLGATAWNLAVILAGAELWNAVAGWLR
jgi:hypothetical protein